jgi:predicted ABC-type ATPase
MPNVIVISGANGAGKSTLAPYLLRDDLGIAEFVNADTIAQGLSAFAPEKSALTAGKIMLSHMKELAEQRKDFAFETTLAARFYAKWLSELQSNGYKFHLVFLYLPNVELAIERVRLRIRLGGHSIPEDVIRRRYAKGLRNFFGFYKPLADKWRLYEVSEEPLLIASGEKSGKINVVEARLWDKIQRSKK